MFQNEMDSKNVTLVKLRRNIDISAEDFVTDLDETDVFEEEAENHNQSIDVIPQMPLGDGIRH